VCEWTLAPFHGAEAQETSWGGQQKASEATPHPAMSGGIAPQPHTGHSLLDRCLMATR
jgi:hypothetical protein